MLRGILRRIERNIERGTGQKVRGCLFRESGYDVDIMARHRYAKHSAVNSITRQLSYRNRQS